MDELRIAGSIKDCIALLLLVSIHRGLPSWTTYSWIRALSDVKMLEPSYHLKITFLFVLILAISSPPLFLSLSLILSWLSLFLFLAFFNVLFLVFFTPSFIPHPSAVSLFSFPPLPPVRGSINLGVKIILQHEEEVEEEEKGEEGEKEKTGTIQSYIKTWKKNNWTYKQNPII